ncbi:MAG: hypothetical protein DYH03_19545 [Nitrospira sp. NTP1]|nr:hypothetical protein [Nitrospira sp. NTP1]
MKAIDEEVLVPVNLGACASIKEAKRVLAPDAVGFSSFDAGTADMQVLNDPEKPCYGQFGGQYSFMVNLALIQAVAKHLGITTAIIETQREFVGSRLGTNVMTLMDLLACHPMVGSKVQPWQLDQLTLKTIRTLNAIYESPYQRKIEFPLRNEMPAEEREATGIRAGVVVDGAWRTSESGRVLSLRVSAVDAGFVLEGKRRKGAPGGERA